MTIKDDWADGDTFSAADENAIAAQVNTNTAAIATKQPLDSDLTTLAGLTATTNNMIVSVASAWASRTPAQVKTTLAITSDDVVDGTTNKQYTATEKTKLAGIATGATANSSDATLLARANHTGTQSADTLTDGTTNKAFLATERTKLTGIATGATANSSDATLLARANHTGTQAASTISDFNTAADARITAATGVSVQGYDADLATLAGLTATTDNFIVSVASAWASRTPAQVRTTLNVANGATANSADATLLARANHTGTQTASTISDFNTAADARVAAGNAATATALQTARTINGVSFNGSADIVVNKPRVSSLTNTTSVSVNSDSFDMVVDTGITGAITLNNPTGTPAEGQTLWYALTGTAARAISYGTAFEDSTVIRPTTTVTTARLDIGFVYNSATSKWRCVASA